ncbi:hypothetical protein EHT25_11390 [Larkinella rosea]|uniref:Uncharacterized protein n=1 Tax=Larkinella rosea TaxID=2025312 RepID=A0A3P1BSN2_9BACT|nr:hypothetical protein EHT25_11390 [Larkinella rosea]
MLVDYYRKLNYYKQLIPNTIENKNLLEGLKKHGFIISNLSPIKDIIRAYKNQESLINMPQYKEARIEYLKLTGNNTKNADIKWYSLFEGPKSVKWLAMRINRFDLHEFYYKIWSNQTHGTDLSTKVLISGDDGNGAVVQLRNMEEAQSIAELTIMFSLVIFNLMMSKTISMHKKEYAEWFLWYRDKHRNPIAQPIK